jgi:hypothetical protein
MPSSSFKERLEFASGEIAERQGGFAAVSFWKGGVVGLIAGAAYGFWVAPRSGAETRAQIAESVENALSRLSGMEVWRPETRSDPAENWGASVANPAEFDGDEE